MTSSPASQRAGRGLRCDICSRKAIMSQPGQQIIRCATHLPTMKETR